MIDALFVGGAGLGALACIVGYLIARHEADEQSDAPPRLRRF